jgi:hypothetical protein
MLAYPMRTIPMRNVFSQLPILARYLVSALSDEVVRTRSIIELSVNPARPYTPKALIQRIL